MKNEITKIRVALSKAEMDLIIKVLRQDFTSRTGTHEEDMVNMDLRKRLILAKTKIDVSKEMGI